MKIARIGAVELLVLGIGLAAQDTSGISGRNYEVFTGQIDLPPQLRTRHNTTSGDRAFAVGVVLSACSYNTPSSRPPDTASLPGECIVPSAGGATHGVHFACKDSRYWIRLFTRIVTIRCVLASANVDPHIGISTDPCAGAFAPFFSTVVK